MQAEYPFRSYNLSFITTSALAISGPRSQTPVRFEIAGFKAGVFVL